MPVQEVVVSHFSSTPVEGDLELAREFKAHPHGHHSPRLQQVLNVFRGEPNEGKYCLVALEPHKKWALGMMHGRAQPIEIFRDKTFDSEEEGEWEVFKLRWKRHVGSDLNID
jgi:hypothetical protein